MASTRLARASAQYHVTNHFGTQVDRGVCRVNFGSPATRVHITDKFRRRGKVDSSVSTFSDRFGLELVLEPRVELLLFFFFFFFLSLPEPQIKTTQMVESLVASPSARSSRLRRSLPSSSCGVNAVPLHRKPQTRLGRWGGYWVDW